jgi:hypothetical protein
MASRPTGRPTISKRPRQDSNLRSRLRRAVLYPLSYGGPNDHVSLAAGARGRRRWDQWFALPVVASVAPSPIIMAPPAALR